MLLLIVLIVLMLICIYFFKQDKYYEYMELSFMGVASFGIIVVVLLVCAVANYSRAPAEQAKMQQQYNSLTYQMQIEYGDEYGRKALMTEIQEYNSKLAYNKKRCHNIWTGGLLPDFYDDLDFIQYEVIPQ